MEKKFIKVEQSSSLNCWDCKKEICINEDFMPYYDERGDCTIETPEGPKQAFVKCRACHTQDPLLHFQECEIYSRVVGYIRPIKQWNPGKRQEWADRKTYKVSTIGKK